MKMIETVAGQKLNEMSRNPFQHSSIGNFLAVMLYDITWLLGLVVTKVCASWMFCLTIILLFVLVLMWMLGMTVRVAHECNMCRKIDMWNIQFLFYQKTWGPSCGHFDRDNDRCFCMSHTFLLRGIQATLLWRLPTSRQRLQAIRNMRKNTR